MRSWTKWTWLPAKIQLASHKPKARASSCPVTTYQAAGAVAVRPSAPIICAGMRALRPSSLDHRLRDKRDGGDGAQKQQSAIGAVPQQRRDADHGDRAQSSDRQQQPVRFPAADCARIGDVPSALSTGVRIQNNASAATVNSRQRRSSSAPPRGRHRRPVSSGISSRPQAPCSRGMTSARKRVRGTATGLKAVAAMSEILVMISPPGCDFSPAASKARCQVAGTATRRLCSAFPGP